MSLSATSFVLRSNADVSSDVAQQIVNAVWSHLRDAVDIHAVRLLTDFRFEADVKILIEDKTVMVWVSDHAEAMGEVLLRWFELGLASAKDALQVVARQYGCEIEATPLEALIQRRSILIYGTDWEDHSGTLCHEGHGLWLISEASELYWNDIRHDAQCPKRAPTDEVTKARLELLQRTQETLDPVELTLRLAKASSVEDLQLYQVAVRSKNIKVCDRALSNIAAHIETTAIPREAEDRWLTFLADYQAYVEQELLVDPGRRSEERIREILVALSEKGSFGNKLKSLWEKLIRLEWLRLLSEDGGTGPTHAEAVSALTYEGPFSKDSCLDLYTDCLFHFAFYLDLNGDREASVDVYSQVLRFAPDHQLAWYNRACEYAILGNKAPALEDLVGAIALNPNYKKLAAAEPYFKGLYSDPDFLRLLGRKRPIRPRAPATPQTK